MKQKELAQRLDISQSHLSDIERGHKTPSQEIVARYAELFELPVSSIWFFNEQLETDLKPSAIDRARGVVADKVLDFLRLIERRRKVS